MLLGLLFIVLLILKLAHVIGWSWWLISLPLWIIPITLAGAVGAFWVGAFSYFFTKLSWQKHKRGGYGKS